MKVYACLVRKVHKMMFINVAAEAITAIAITWLLSSEESCFIWIFEQSVFLVIKVVFVLSVFIFSVIGDFTVIFVVIFVAAVAVVLLTDVLGVCVVGANLSIGSSTKNTVAF